MFDYDFREKSITVSSWEDGKGVPRFETNKGRQEGCENEEEVTNKKDGVDRTFSKGKDG